MKKHPSGLLVCLFLVVFVPVALPQQTKNSVDAYVKKQMQDQRIPAIAVLVERSDQVLFRGSYGFANLQMRTPIRSDTVFQLASTTKIFTGVALMILEQNGKLTLDDRVGKYLPSLPGAWRAVTIRQLAQHTSGLPDVVDNPNLPPTPEFLALTEERALAIAEAKPILAKPGQKFIYDQTNYVLLKMLIKRLSGLGFEDFVKASIFRPLGMSSTDWGDLRSVAHNRTDYYSVPFAFPGSPKPQKPMVTNMVNGYVYPEYLFSAAGLNSTIADLGRFGAALASGKLLNATELDSMFAPAIGLDGKPLDLAPMMRLKGSMESTVGWTRTERPGGAHPCLWMSGGGSTAFLYFPQDRLTVVVLTNLQGANTLAIGEGIAAHYIPGLNRVFPDAD